MGGSEQGWFHAAMRDDLGTMKRNQYFRSVVDDSRSQCNGLSALHLAAIYESRQVYSYLLPHERDVLTTNPISLTCPRLSCKIPLPEGLSFQHILAVKGKQQQLEESLCSEGIVRSPISLAACCLLGLPESFVKRHPEVRAASAKPQANLMSPIKVACVLGLNNTISYFAEHKLEDERWIDECASELDDIHSWPESRALGLMYRNLLNVETCKDIVRRFSRQSLADASSEAGLKRSLSVYDFVHVE